MVPVAETAGKVVRNKWFWIGLAILIVILILRRYYPYLKSKFARSYGDFSGEKITESRKTELETMAQDLYDKIYGGYHSINTRSDLMHKVAAINDDELLYLSRYYKNAITRSNSLYKDISNEFMPFASGDQVLMSRLAKIGQL